MSLFAEINQTFPDFVALTKSTPQGAFVAGRGNHAA
jgi:hypothetical protein